MRDHINGYSFSWTQPYNVSMNPFYNQQNVDVENELARLDFLEEEIQQMTSYPDAEALIKNIFKY
jgi:hypothetical protein